MWFLCILCVWIWDLCYIVSWLVRCVCLLLITVGCLISCIFCLFDLRSVVVECGCFLFGLCLIFRYVDSLYCWLWFYLGLVLLLMVFGFYLWCLAFWFTCCLFVYLRFVGIWFCWLFVLGNWLCLFCNFVNSVASCIVSVIVVWICLFAIFV